MDSTPDNSQPMGSTPGPAAPPTSETMVLPVTARIRPGVMRTAAPLRAFSARSAAVKPRSR